MIILIINNNFQRKIVSRETPDVLITSSFVAEIILNIKVKDWYHKARARLLLGIIVNYRVIGDRRQSLDRFFSREIRSSWKLYPERFALDKGEGRDESIISVADVFLSRAQPSPLISLSLSLLFPSRDPRQVPPVWRVRRGMARDRVENDRSGVVKIERTDSAPWLNSNTTPAPRSKIHGLFVPGYRVLGIW